MLILCPILIFLIYDVRDAYGLKKELMVTLFSGAFSYAAFFVIEIILPQWRNYFGSLMFAWITFILCHTLSITMPLIRSFKNKTYVVPNSKFSSTRNKIKRSLSIKKNNQKNNNNNFYLLLKSFCNRATCQWRNWVTQIKNTIFIKL